MGMGGHSPNRNEMILHFMLLVSAILAMASLYFTSSYSTMLWIYFAGAVGGLVIAVPDYAFFNRSPLMWHEPLRSEAAVTQAMARMNKRVQKLSENCSSFPCFPTSAMYSAGVAR
jgi:hypothetical protein